MGEVEQPQPDHAGDPQPAELELETAELPPEDVDTIKLGRRRGIEDSFIGRAAQLAVMAELHRLNCNVAIPEVDLGSDLLAFREDRSEIVRIQVKACTVPRDYAEAPATPRSSRSP